MSMITGFIPPSSGTAFINDLDIRTDMELIRKNLGLCPQHDILFDNLTVTEHLMFAARLKGVTDPLKLKKEIDEMIVNINLFRKKEVLAKNLSGGMRRRLSLGMALIGGTKIVILDEPTSGLDPDARREIWTLLQKERANRTMLLTTHFMDEAEILGDRVAIMSAGQIQCCGTPLFLKNCYGAEYHLSLVKAEKCDVSKVLEVVAESVPEYRIESNVSNELSILLPAASSPAFPKLFHDIESNKVELGIRSYGASVTTMEEVFLKVGSYEEEEQARRAEVEAEQEHLNEAHIIRERQLPAPVVDSSASINIPFSASESLRFNTGFQFLFQQFLSLLHKRWIVFRQHKILSLAQMLVPVVFTALGIFITRAAPVAVKGPPLNLDLSSFQNLVMPYAVGANSSITSEDSKIIQSFVNLFRSRRNTEVVNVTKADASYLDYLIDFSKKDLFRYNRQYIIGSTFEKNINTNTLEWTAYFNNQPFHTVGILQNYISNALLAVQGDGQCSVSTVNHPLPMTINDELNDLTIQSALGFSFSITLVFGMAFLISSFAPPLIRERVSKSKHLQYISGCKTVSYWLSAYLWDLLNFFVPSVLVIITLAIFNETPYVGDFRFMVTFFLLFSFSACAIPFIYLLSHLFTIPSSGLTWLVRFNILTGLISILTVNILRIPQLNLVEYAKALEWVFYIFLPNFCLGQGFTNIYTNNLYLSLCTKPEIAQLCELNLFSSPCCPKTCGNNCLQYEENYLSWNPYGIGRSLFFMYLQGMICWVVLFLMETSGFTYLKSLISAKAKNVFYVPLVEEEAVSMQDSEDSDLKEERELIESSDLNELRKVKSVIMRNVSKTYGTFRAVDRVSCTVTPGNCFGLLGVNGAGKTTTFNMLTGDLDLTAGEVYINGYDLASSCRDAQRTLGYCPQYDALIEEMTGREQLTFYCHLRGMDKTQISSEVERLLKTLNLQNYADVQCGTYSGGNKRKLNTALALVGSPPLVCLDEPTTGMDPGARRQLWNTLTKYRNEGNTLILTSHSMEECEALCTQVVIMVNGRFQCIGSIQHLKTKFAEGYTALIQLAYPTEEVGEKRVTNLMDFMSREFGEHYSVKDRHQGHVHFQILKSPSLTWARIFGLFESNRQSLNIVHYSVTQTSLEQVFLGFARNQVPPLEAPERKCFLRCCQHKTKD